MGQKQTKEPVAIFYRDRTTQCCIIPPTPKIVYSTPYVDVADILEVSPGLLKVRWKNSHLPSLDVFATRYEIVEKKIR